MTAVHMASIYVFPLSYVESHHADWGYVLQCSSKLSITGSASETSGTAAVISFTVSAKSSLEIAFFIRDAHFNVSMYGS